MQDEVKVRVDARRPDTGHLSALQVRVLHVTDRHGPPLWRASRRAAARHHGARMLEMEVEQLKRTCDTYERQVAKLAEKADAADSLREKLNANGEKLHAAFSFLVNFKGLGRARGLRQPHDWYQMGPVREDVKNLMPKLR